jgi:phage tail-like protein
MATDLDVAPDGALVVACGPGQPFRRFRGDAGEWSEIQPLGAPGYDGGAIAFAPDGRLGFTTASGLGWTAGAHISYTSSGRVVGYRMDATVYRTRWGRVFLDACIPPGTDVRLRFLTSDDDVVPDPLPVLPPSRSTRAIPAPDDTHPMPSQVQLAELTSSWPLYKRSTGREWPWAQIAADDTFETYEAPVNAPPGRYLWVVVELSGPQRSSPRVRELRVERPGHQLLRQLPRTWSRDEADAAFLHRFLAPAEGMLHGLDEDAATREVLIDPAATPQEALGWLASLAGLVLDRRWPEDALRSLIAEAFQLFRLRGTQAGLERLLELYLGYPVPVVEAWRLRGLGGAVLGLSPGGPAAPYVGGAARSSGALGRFMVGGTGDDRDGYTATAHRFSVLIPADLSSEQRDVVRDIVENHKPAHTLAEICELGAGMRVGRLLHVELTSVVGPGAQWGPAVVGQVLVGGDGVVGLPAVGARLSTSSKVGLVRVG